MEHSSGDSVQAINPMHVVEDQGSSTHGTKNPNICYMVKEAQAIIQLKAELDNIKAENEFFKSFLADSHEYRSLSALKDEVKGWEELVHFYENKYSQLKREVDSLEADRSHYIRQFTQMLEENDKLSKENRRLNNIIGYKTVQ